METIETKVQVNADRVLTLQLPAHMQIGEYDVVLVLNNRSVGTDPQEVVQSKSEQPDPTIALAWEKWVEEVEQLPRSPNPIQGDYRQHLIEKYRQQGLDL